MKQTDTKSMNGNWVSKIKSVFSNGIEVKTGIIFQYCNYWWDNYRGDNIMKPYYQKGEK